MASRNERRRRARQRATQSREASHGDRMMAVVVKAAESRQARVRTDTTWDPEKTVQPPIDPAKLWNIFELNAFHSGAINAKVADAVGRGWKLTPEDDTEDGTDSDVDAVKRKVEDTLKGVCTNLTWDQLCQQAVRELDAVGWGVWEILRDRDGDPKSDIVGILPVPAQSIRAVKDSDDVFCMKRGDKKVYFKRFGYDQPVSAKDGNVSENVPEDDRANELVIFKHYSPRSDYYGIPLWVSALPAIAELAAIREYNVSFFESGGQADRHVHVTAKDDQVAKTLADDIVKQLEDARGEAHVSLVTHGDSDTGVETTPLTPKGTSGGSAQDRQFRGGREDLIEETLVAHQVPPYRVGIAKTGSLGGDVAEEMNETYQVGVVEPLQEIVEAELERTVFGDLGFGPLIAGYRYEFEDMTKDDEESTHDRVMEGVDRAVLSPNDAREAIGLDRVEDPALDRHYLGGEPISTDSAVTDVKQMLGELKDALNAAVGAAGSPQASPDDENDQEDVAPEGDEQAKADTQDRRRRRYKWFRS